jgi:hypothetical protein
MEVGQSIGQQKLENPNGRAIPNSENYEGEEETEK